MALRACVWVYSAAAAAATVAAAGGNSSIGYINKLQLQNEGSWMCLRYPRSQWLTAQLAGGAAPVLGDDHGNHVAGGGAGAPAIGPSTGVAMDLQLAHRVFAEIASSADFSEMHGGGDTASASGLGAKNVTAEDAAFFRSCAVVVGMDRNEYARETAGYETRLRTMPGLDGFGKADLLLGWLP